MAEYKISTPLNNDDLQNLKAGDRVYLSGTLYTARDAAHMRIIAAIKNGDELPFDPKGQIIYFVGPTPTRPGKVIGSAGPTTSYRMNPFTPVLMKMGLKGVIGKGKMSDEVKECCKTNKALYLTTVGGAAALVAKSIKKAEIIAYSELGPEAVREIVVEDMPLFVCYDSYGGDLYESEKEKYRRD
ncbi:MAG: Fe-S-containing hydro-lyase [Spirochaetota bacterium]|nr:Fe-S-containing hydro-lyase [Spirochaetota bacterium]